MSRFLLRRLGFVLLTILLSSVVIFIATQVLPGDVATMVLGRFSTEQAKAALRSELGLDKPIVVQYGRWVTDFLRGDSRISVFHQRRRTRAHFFLACGTRSCWGPWVSSCTCRLALPWGFSRRCAATRGWTTQSP